MTVFVISTTMTAATMVPTNKLLYSEVWETNINWWLYLKGRILMVTVFDCMPNHGDCTLTHNKLRWLYYINKNITVTIINIKKTLVGGSPRCLPGRGDGYIKLKSNSYINKVSNYLFFYPALNHTLWFSIKPFPSTQLQTIIFDPESNHTLLQSI